MLLATVFYFLAVFADVDFLKPLSLIGMMLGGVLFLGGTESFKTCVGPLGFLVFMIPWPTLIQDHLGLPLQLISSAYAALFAGMLGVPIHREGVQIFVQPDLNASPVYAMVVAQQCSGLTSMTVLLALTYFMAYLTPVKMSLRILMVGAVIPLAIITNSTRLTIILLFGAHGNVILAKWVHDHEGPVLIFFCSIALMGLRHFLITRSSQSMDGNLDVSLSPSHT